MQAHLLRLMMPIDRLHDVLLAAFSSATRNRLCPTSEDMHMRTICKVSTGQRCSTCCECLVFKTPGMKLSLRSPYDVIHILKWMLMDLCVCPYVNLWLLQLCPRRQSFQQDTTDAKILFHADTLCFIQQLMPSCCQTVLQGSAGLAQSSVTSFQSSKLGELCLLMRWPYRFGANHRSLFTGCGSALRYTHCGRDDQSW